MCGCVFFTVNFTQDGSNDQLYPSASCPYINDFLVRDRNGAVMGEWRYKQGKP